MTARGTEPLPLARRRGLWVALVLLVFALMAMLVWLAARFESAQAQERLDRDAQDAVTELRSTLLQHAQAVQALESRSGGDAQTWRALVAEVLSARRSMLRIEHRDASLQVMEGIDGPFRKPAFRESRRDQSQPEVQLACAMATRLNSHAYGPYYFVPMGDGTGLEVFDLCHPIADRAVPERFVVVTYSLTELLREALGPRLPAGVEVSLNQVDGGRVALLGAARRGIPTTRASHLLDLPGGTLVLQLNQWGGRAGLFPNVLTALVAAMTLALAGVLILLAADMRRRQRAERQLAEALAFRKAMEDSLVTGLRARDGQGRTTYVNPAFCDMVGWDAPSLLSEDPTPPYWPPERIQEYQARQTERLAGQVPPREGFESVFMRRDGKRFPVMVFEAPLIEADGAHAGWMSAIVDISVQRQVEELSRASQERLQATSRLAAVGEMASLLSHELNQPLAAISSYAAGSINLMQERDPQAAPAMIEDALRQIAAQARRAGHIIRSVHDFVRRRDGARERVHPRALVDAILPLIQLQARKIGASVRVECEPSVPEIWCDRTMLEQALLNLARNGLQAMDEQQPAHRQLHVLVRMLPAERGVDRVCFSVADLGCGIAPEVAERLFTPFFTTRVEGMGLGLSLCRTVAEQHGGALWHEDNQPRGTVFHCSVRIEPADAAQISAAPEERTCNR